MRPSCRPASGHTCDMIIGLSIPAPATRRATGRGGSGLWLPQRRRGRDGVVDGSAESWGSCATSSSRPHPADPGVASTPTPGDADETCRAAPALFDAATASRPASCKPCTVAPNPNGSSLLEDAVADTSAQLEPASRSPPHMISNHESLPRCPENPEARSETRRREPRHPRHVATETLADKDALNTQ